MFRGRFEHTIDEKGRLSVPSKFREILGSQFDDRLIVTHFDGCLWGYPVTEWQRIEEKVANLPQFKPEVKALQRVFISAATECPLDRSGRILITPTLRDYADLQKDVVMVGMTRRIEMWSSERWKKEFEKSQKEIQNFGDTLADLGL
jgi:MraZ protein